jgi:hypothetical protein
MLPRSHNQNLLAFGSHSTDTPSSTCTIRHSVFVGRFFRVLGRNLHRADAARDGLVNADPVGHFGLAAVFDVAYHPLEQLGHLFGGVRVDRDDFVEGLLRSISPVTCCTNCGSRLNVSIGRCSCSRCSLILIRDHASPKMTGNFVVS